jgi:hypothetical protein
MKRSAASIEDTVGNTPLVRLKRIPGAGNDKRGNVVLAKLERRLPEVRFDAVGFSDVVDFLLPYRALARRAQCADEPLGDDDIDRVGDEKRLDPHLIKTTHGAGGVVRVER